MMEGNNCTKPFSNPGVQPPVGEEDLTVIRLDGAIMDLPPPGTTDVPPVPRDADLETRYVFTGLHATGGLGPIPFNGA
jgi:hypothetical protein